MTMDKPEIFKYLLLVIVLVVVAFFYWKSAIVGTVSKFTVKYGKREVEHNEKFSRKEVLAPPHVEYLGARGDRYYTMMMIDPDNTTIDSTSMWPEREWLVVDVPGLKIKENSRNLEGSGGAVVTPYEGARNPKDTEHKHYLELYEQPHKLVSNKVRDSTHNWDYEGFLDRHKLKKVGERSFIS